MTDRKNTKGGKRKSTVKISKKSMESFDKPNLIIHARGLKYKVTVNDEVYSKDDEKKIRNIVDRMSEDIWIDRTYVCYKGNRFKDAYIVEDKWYEMCKNIIYSITDKRCSKEISNEVAACVATIAMVYLYSIVEKYGYDVDNIDISPKGKSRFMAEYTIDSRTEWNF